MKIKVFTFVVYLGALLFTLTAHAQSLAGLSYEDRSSVEIACSYARTQGPASYHTCLNQQLAELGNDKAPSLAGLSYNDRSSVEIACSYARTQGPASYHTCLNQQLGNPVAPPSNALVGIASPQPSVSEAATRSLLPPAASPLCAENGSCYGDISARTGLPKTVPVHGYYRANGTYVQGYYRSK
jgi:hypothetical protein